MVIYTVEDKLTLNKWSKEENLYFVYNNKWIITTKGPEEFDSHEDDDICNINATIK